MRATYQLNTEKLEYNYRVLTERDMENSATLSHQKRKLTKLKDALSGLVQVRESMRRRVGACRFSSSSQHRPRLSACVILCASTSFVFLFGAATQPPALDVCMSADVHADERPYECVDRRNEKKTLLRGGGL